MPYPPPPPPPPPQLLILYIICIEQLLNCFLDISVKEQRGFNSKSIQQAQTISGFDFLFLADSSFDPVGVQVVPDLVTTILICLFLIHSLRNINKETTAIQPDRMMK